jgi:alcohol dehydrogenase class IV
VFDERPGGIFVNVISTFSFPTTILFGEGALAELPHRLTAPDATKPLLVTDRGLIATRAFAMVRDAIGRDVRVFSDIQSNPTQQNVSDAVAAYRAGECDSVIACGGGSAIDVAKVIRLALKSDKPLTDVTGDEPLDKLAPFIAIPTTAGTGSEVGRSSVITIRDRKHVIFHPRLLADLVILDPRLTIDLPAKLTAATGADALTHCIESFTSPVFHPLCDAIALEGIHLIAGALRLAVNEPTNLQARGEMQIAATMGGIAFQKDLGATHSLAHPLSALCNIHHGTANALCLPAVMRFNASRKPGVYHRVGKAMDLSDPSDQNTVAAVESLLREIGMSGGLRGAGVTDSQLNALADHAFADSCHKTNPVPVTRDDLLELYKRAM